MNPENKSSPQPEGRTPQRQPIDGILDTMRLVGITPSRGAYLAMYYAPDPIPDEIPIEVEMELPPDLRQLPEEE